MALPFEDASAATMALTEPIDTRQLTVSGYLAEMARDLKVLAANADLSLLAYLLSVAEEEARSTNRVLRNQVAMPAEAKVPDPVPAPQDAP
jgi:hypothetical protein